jgi:YVTN family beta-propeller protein
MKTSYKLLSTTVGLGLVFGGICGAQPFVYVANNQSPTVTVIDTVANTVVAGIPVGRLGDSAIVINPTGSRAYVSNTNNFVSVIDTASNSVIATIPVGNQPLDIAITTDGTFAYVANNLSNSVSVIRTADNTLV